MIGRFIAVVGPSGVGKDSVMQALAAQDARFVLARRVITRPSDAGGEAFEGVSEATFKAQEAAGEFALSWSAHGLFYAIPGAVSDDLQQGRDVLANLSRAVLLQALAQFARFEVINLTAERAILAQRLTARGRETADQIASRLDRATAPLPDEIKRHDIDNSAGLSATVQAILARLYPVRV